MRAMSTLGEKWVRFSSIVGVKSPIGLVRCGGCSVADQGELRSLFRIE